MINRVPVHPVLFAAYAVLFLYSVNLSLVLPVDAAVPLARAVIGAAIAWLVASLLFRDIRRGAVVATALVVAFFGYGHVAGLIEGLQVGDAVQLVAWAVLVIGAVVYAARARGSLPRTTGALNVIAGVLVVITLVSIVPYEFRRADRAASTSPADAASDVVLKPGVTPDKRDIYFLIFDRYGSAEAIDRRFGITDNPMYDWLREQGFQVPVNSHGNYRATDFSLTATLNMQYLDNLTESIGRTSGDRTPAHEMLQHHLVGRFLKSQGYRYYQLGSWAEFTRTIEIADENLSLGVTSEFENVLSDTTAIPAAKRLLGITNAEPTFRDRVRDGTLYQLRQLQRLASAPSPKFVFAHILVPHDPYVFHADGSVVTAAEEKATDERVMYEQAVAYANDRIKEIVGRLLSGPEETRPIVIIEGDEGPLACQNVDCVGTDANYYRIRFGNLIAMYLPGKDVTLPDTFSSVNTFRTVLSAYFGADLPPLPDRSFTWPDDQTIYDFRDVTDLLAGPGG